MHCLKYQRSLNKGYQGHQSCYNITNEAFATATVLEIWQLDNYQVALLLSGLLPFRHNSPELSQNTKNAFVSKFFVRFSAEAASSEWWKPKWFLAHWAKNTLKWSDRGPKGQESKSFSFFILTVSDARFFFARKSLLPNSTENDTLMTNFA